LLGRLYTGDRFIYFDATADEPIQSDVIGGYLPLWCGLGEDVTASVRARLDDRYASAFGLPSTSPKDAAYDVRRGFRGPTSTSLAWMLHAVHGEAALGDKCVELANKSGCRAHYAADTGEGLGPKRFTTTAALVLDLLARA
jgi:hypothetical protein